MRPTGQLLVSSITLFVLAVVAAIFSGWGGLLIVVSLVLVFVVLLDVSLLLLRGSVSFERQLPPRFALQEKTTINYVLYNHGKLPLRARFFDGLPEECLYRSLPFELPKLKPRQRVSSSYEVTFLQRGDLIITPGYLELRSFFGFWWLSRRIGVEEVVQVYPNYVPALNYGLLATADRAEVMGIIKPRKRGMSKEFHQLRDYYEGDSISQIDWKATSRHNRLITREYQEERDQTILLVPDCSIRTRVIDGELPLLDHLLNAAILLSYIALGQGDKVGMMSFGGEPRYLAPAKGPQGMASILDHLYDYQSTREYGDYADLVARILRTQSKRCLVIVLTNLRTEDQFGSLGALQLLTEKHLVLLASVKETAVQEALASPLETVKDASRYLGALAYEEDIEEIMAQARGRGFSAVHEPLETFPIALANQFLDLRTSGRF